FFSAKGPVSGDGGQTRAAPLVEARLERSNEGARVEACRGRPSRRALRTSRRIAAGDVLGERYRIDRLLARGGMGAGYPLLDEALELSRKLGDLSGQGHALHLLAILEQERGATREARTCMMRLSRPAGLSGCAPRSCSRSAIGMGWRPSTGIWP